MRLSLAVALIIGATPLFAQEAELLHEISWTYDHEDFGGVSGLDFHDDGKNFTAITDRGRLIQGYVERASDAPPRIFTTDLKRLIIRPNQDMKKAGPDGEGLTVAKSGAIFASFEGVHRVREIVSDDDVRDLPQHPDFASFKPNGSMEALASDDKGRLYVLPERSGQLIRPFPVYRFDGSDWMAFGTIDRRDGFLPVGADVGPDGRFYLLERAFNGTGFRSRITRYLIADHGLIDPEILLDTGTGDHGNLEAISVWTDSQNLYATMVADDNFLPIQDTEFIEYLLPD